MDKTLKIYIALLVLLILAIVVIDSNHPKPIDWTPTYSVNDKIPYGMYVFDKEIGSLLKNQKVERFNCDSLRIFRHQILIEDTLVENYKVKGTFINISELQTIDEQSIKEIFYFVRHGNNAFLSMK